MLDVRLACGKAEDITDKFVTRESAGGKTAFVLDDHHQIIGVGQIILSPDCALQGFGLGELCHAGQFADHRCCHAEKLSVESVISDRKLSFSVTPMPAPCGTAMRPSVASSGSWMMSRAK